MMTMQQFVAALEQMQNDMPAIMSELAVSEAQQAVEFSKMIVMQKGKVETGRYLNGFTHGDAQKDSEGAPARQNKGICELDVFNNVPYAGRLEYGNQNLAGTYALATGINMMKQGQQARINKKLEEALAKYTGGGGKNGA